MRKGRLWGMKEREVASMIHCFNKRVLDFYGTGRFVLSMSIRTSTVPAFKSWKLMGERYVNNQSLGYVMGLPW